MRILLIAYEFPPSASAQSLRWAYLVRELDRLGHEVHVLTVHLAEPGTGLPALPSTVQVHRTFAGPLRGSLVAWREHKLQRAGGQTYPASTDTGPAQAPPPPNWKYRLVEALQDSAAWFLFPDQRGEWWPWARRALDRLLERLQPDIVIASHEPATSLQLGLHARRKGIPLLADLGDPVLAPYTPRRWRRKALALEREICTHANHIIVTTAATADLLAQRHARHERMSVLTQGHDDQRLPDTDPPAPLPFDAQRLELLYTGNFYRFRRPDALIAAVRAHPAARLTVATPSAPRSILEACRDAPSQFRLAGFLPHADALALQRGADVLVNIANDDPCQVPGKLFEYLGSGRPVLYLGDANHPAANIVVGAGNGWAVGNEVGAISAMIVRLLQEKGEGGLPQCAPVAEYGWSRIAARLQGILEDELPDAGRSGCPSATTET